MVEPQPTEERWSAYLFLTLLPVGDILLQTREVSVIRIPPRQRNELRSLFVCFNRAQLESSPIGLVDLLELFFVVFGELLEEGDEALDED